MIQSRFSQEEKHPNGPRLQSLSTVPIPSAEFPLLYEEHHQIGTPLILQSFSSFSQSSLESGSSHLRFQKKATNYFKSDFSQAEDAIIRNFAESGGSDWKICASMLSNKSARCARDRWFHYLR